MIGKADRGAMVCTPLPGILNSITTSLVEVSALASRMACRSEPGPLSAVLVTVKVEAWPAQAAISKSAQERKRAPKLCRLRIADARIRDLSFFMVVSIICLVLA